MKRRSNRPAKIDWKKILIVGVILLIAGYKWYSENGVQLGKNKGDANGTATSEIEEADDDRYEARLPDEFDADKKKPDRQLDFDAGNDNSIPINSRNDGESQTEKSGDKEADKFLVSIGRNQLQSPAGLIYGGGPRGETRLEHVMRHAEDIPDRDSHGVFNGDQVTILKLIDEAYEMVKSKSKYVKSASSEGNTAYTISMGRTIGYDGGQKGQRNGHRELKILQLVLDGKRVITAYPYR